VEGYIVYCVDALVFVIAVAFEGEFVLFKKGPGRAKRKYEGA
jgi:hypothetical protein